MSRILFVDDDDKYQKLIKDLLEREGYDVDPANDSTAGVDLFKENSYDLVISDLIMNTLDGLQFVSILKRIDNTIPIIILTGHEDFKKEIEGFDLDIDDYIYKPVSMEVLMKRIGKRIKTKKVAKGQDTLYSEKDNITVKVRERKVFQDDEVIRLTVRGFNLLCFFLNNKNQAYTREELLEHVWRVTDELVDARTVDTHVKKLRQKIRTNSIISVRGVGYEWFE